MKVALVGVGTAGGRVVDRTIARARETGRSFCGGDVLVFDTTRAGFTPGNVSEDRRVLLGDTHPDVDGGVEGDVDLGAEVARAEGNEIRRAFDRIELYAVDAILLVAGLGGGTGGGVGAALLEELDATYDTPVYAVGVLPRDDDGGQQALNAARSLRSFVPLADNVLLFDNEAWRDHIGDDSDGGYEAVNRALAARLVALFAAGELETSAVSETLLDTSDLVRTLDTGGVSSIGYASMDLGASGGLFSRLRGLFGGGTDEGRTDAQRIKTLVSRALGSRLTLSCEVDSAERALLVLSGPSGELSRRGFESAIGWLEGETDTPEVLAGDEPSAGDALTATVLLSNVTDVPRIDALQERALAARGTKAPADDGVLPDATE